jgi:hypothetical protein
MEEVKHSQGLTTCNTCRQLPPPACGPQQGGLSTTALVHSLDTSVNDTNAEAISALGLGTPAPSPHLWLCQAISQASCPAGLSYPYIPQGQRQAAPLQTHRTAP